MVISHQAYPCAMLSAESNPEVMNAYIGKLGFPISQYK